MTIINRRLGLIYLKSRKTASSSIEIHLIANTECGKDIYSTSREIIPLGYERSQNQRPLTPGRIQVWYTPGERENWARRHIRGASRLLPQLQQHDSAKRVRALVGGRFFDRAVKVTPVRNPWDAIVSYYLWELSGGQGRKETCEAGWNEWFDQKMRVGSETSHVTEAEKFLFDPWLRIARLPVRLHFIYFEDIPLSLSELAGLIGQPEQDFSNLSFHFKKAVRDWDYRTFYSDQQAEAVAQAFRGYLERTGYSFDRPGLAPCF